MEGKQQRVPCEYCTSQSTNEFKKVAGLRNSGLLIFVHKEKQSTVLPYLERRSIKPKEGETFILYNAGDKELKRADYIIEMCQYRTKCFQCKTVVQRVRSLLDEITDIKRNEVLGLCEHCKRASPSGKCRRCEYIVNKFLCNKVKLYEERQNRFKSWLCKVNQFLHTILESERVVCKHNLYKESSALELERLLEELKSPIEMRQPDITFFPTETGPLISMIQSKEMLEELLIKLKSESFKERSSDDSLFVSPSRTATSCVCKHFMDKKNEGRLSTELPHGHESLTILEPKLDSKTRNNVSKASVELTVTTVDKDLSKNKYIKNSVTKGKAEATSHKQKTGKENVSPDKEPKILKETTPNKNPKEKTLKEDKVPKECKPQKAKLSPEDEMMLKMMKDRQKEKEKKEKTGKQDKFKEFAKIESLPQLKKRQVIEIVEEKSESVVECGHEDVLINEMIKGRKVVRFNPHYKERTPDSNAPLLFRMDPVYSEPEALELPIVSTNTTTTTTVEKEKKTKGRPLQEEASTKGVIKYELSNREFIENGWTILPTTKFMRRMNIYKMEPANPRYDWFKRHKYQKIMFYDTSEKLAEINDNGRGTWFYKNGMVALDYYNAQELNAGQRYVIYSSGEEVENGKTKPVTVLASFDFLGNGVVYDHYGNVRLKYNQTEGIVVDGKIGPPGRWKWHSLNEPPILQPVYIDSYVKHREPCLDELLKKDDKSETSSKRTADHDSEMLAIEFENFVKAKADKLLQKFKPFQIRMKALKVNNQFSLRIMDQAKIYLQFRDGQVSLKLNLGMLLISTEIVDTEATEVSKVATPYDRIPPRTSSVAEIQHALNNARRIGKAHAKNVIPDKKSNASGNSI